MIYKYIYTIEYIYIYITILLLYIHIYIYITPKSYGTSQCLWLLFGKEHIYEHCPQPSLRCNNILYKNKSLICCSSWKVHYMDRVNADFVITGILSGSCFYETLYLFTSIKLKYSLCILLDKIICCVAFNMCISSLSSSTRVFSDK